MHEQAIETIETKPKRDPRALNAYRHGLTGQVHIGTIPEQEAYDEHCATVFKSLAPVEGMETELAQTVADHLWRLKRAIAVEATIYSMGIATSNNSTNQNPEAFGGFAMAAEWLKDDKKIALISLYVSRIQRDIEKSRKMLHDLQAERRAALEKAAEESNLLAQLIESKGESYDLARDFPAQTIPPQFVFSTDEIARHAAHLRALSNAKTLIQARQKLLRKAA